MAITHPSYLYQRQHIWYFRPRIPRHLYIHIDLKEYKISLKTRDLGLAKEDLFVLLLISNIIFYS